MSAPEPFSARLRVNSMTPMEKNLALQILEARILTMLVENDKGVATVTRAIIQNESVDKRLDLITKLADKIFAIHQTPGKHDAKKGSFAWEKKIVPMLSAAFQEVYGALLTGVDIKPAEVKIKGQ